MFLRFILQKHLWQYTFARTMACLFRQVNILYSFNILYSYSVQGCFSKVGNRMAEQVFQTWKIPLHL